MPNHPRCQRQLPTSVLLGAGAVRGLAHVGVLRSLLDAGIQISELVGTSVGAIVTGFYGAVGFDLDGLQTAGLTLKSKHLFAWALLRRLPPCLRDRYSHLAGDIPSYLERLGETSFAQMHHGLSRIGIVSYDLLSQTQVVCHNENPIMRLEDAVRGAAALPGLFRPLRCKGSRGEYLLVDGGVRDKLPAHVLFSAPFRPVQVLAVDISTTPADRTENLGRLNQLRQQYPHIPIDCICVDTIDGPSVVYRSSYLPDLLAQGYHAGDAYVSQLSH